MCFEYDETPYECIGRLKMRIRNPMKLEGTNQKFQRKKTKNGYFGGPKPQPFLHPPTGQIFQKKNKKMSFWWPKPGPFSHPPPILIHFRGIQKRVRLTAPKMVTKLAPVFEKIPHIF